MMFNTLIIELRLYSKVMDIIAKIKIFLHEKYFMRLANILDSWNQIS